jgi:hypothetical protein
MKKLFAKSMVEGAPTSAPADAPQGETPPLTPPAETITLTRAELKKMMADAAREAVAAMPAAEKETVVLRGEIKRDQEAERAKIEAEFQARVDAAEAELRSGHHRFVVKAASQPKGTKYVCAGDANTSVPTAMVIAIAKYQAYFGIIAVLEVEKAPKADYFGLASECAHEALPSLS